MNTKGTKAAPGNTRSMGMIVFWVVMLVLGVLAFGVWWGKGKYYELRKKYGDKLSFLDDDKEVYQRLN